MNIMKPGDFSNLADDYASFRPGYARDVCRAALALPNAPAGKLDVADVGAGTGIWTRTLHAMGCHKLTAVEPNEAMRAQGVRQSEGLSINWKSGSGEDTTLPTASQDVLTMASSFHWPDEAAAMSEFHRVLRPGGWFAALWNTRYIEASPLLVEIEAELHNIVPDLNRVSSGRSEFTAGLTSRLLAAQGWGAPVYIEGYHTERMSRARYLGIWRSVNDVQQQAGPERFQRFLDYIEDRLSDHDEVDAVYQTRLWAVQSI
jgi:ubiquinone/menaquinone biosynthesis C-methylase UbiE